MQVVEPYVSRFWSRVKILGSDECWPWLRHRLRDGYGQFWCGEQVMAHRFSYECEHGEGAADGVLVLHSCDNPPCCNPAHLFDGDYQDNMDDKHAKGRERYINGNECSWQKLTDEDVEVVRRMLSQGIVQRRIAEKFNVSPALICLIKQGVHRVSV